MKALITLAVAIALALLSTVFIGATRADAGNALSFTPKPLPPLVQPEYSRNWTGFNLGIDAGAAIASLSAFSFGDRDVTEDQCRKHYNGQDIKSLDMVYCLPGASENSALNQHYVDHAVLYEDVVVGSETYEDYTEWEERILVYGAHAQYLQDFGTLVVGAELGYLVYNTDALPFDGVTTISALAGIDLGDLLLYAHVGQSYAGDLSGLAYGVGGDVMFTSRVSVGAKWTSHDLGEYAHDTVVARIAYHF